MILFFRTIWQYPNKWFTYIYLYPKSSRFFWNDTLQFMRCDVNHDWHSQQLRSFFRSLNCSVMLWPLTNLLLETLKMLEDDERREDFPISLDWLYLFGTLGSLKYRPHLKKLLPPYAYRYSWSFCSDNFVPSGFIFFRNKANIVLKQHTNVLFHYTASSHIHSFCILK